nr:sulfite exporter TauE/SafE family protein [Geobacter sp. OR-1]
MLDYCITTLQNAASQPIGLFFALLLGSVSAATSACCTLPAMGILIGYSGARQESNHRAAVSSVVFFTVGTVVSLMIIGGIAGFVGQTAQLSLGGYWKIFAGIIAILFGLATLKLLPFKLPEKKQYTINKPFRQDGAGCCRAAHGWRRGSELSPLQSGHFYRARRGDLTGAGTLGDTLTCHVCNRFQHPAGNCFTGRFSG